MCKQVDCPNDGKPTWWGCGAHIEIALAGVPEQERCQCPHVPVEGKPGVYEVRKQDK
uniref:Uncharacterized protein n=1 Tax=Kwoniella bestiolae CBS 10118 TaxID=1296100 RepID=A0A1B9G146_9TREE|nr:hypothetical protein I302_06197 [Kwoniella bestiolae CBS 10118]OCF24736.1 hypothetical protein I302_06197 [Kwoniella bestiolae CBS 10118]